MIILLYPTAHNRHREEHLRLLLAIVCLAGFVPASIGQTANTFKIRLSPVPLDATMRATVTGKGAAAATLSGNKLTIDGTFEGLASPATIAQIHQSKVTGIRGPVVTDITVSKAASGTVSASLTLTPEQIDALRKGRLYIQIHSEKAPDGNLWGWLLK